MLYILYDIFIPEPSTSFSVISWLVTIIVTVLSDVTDIWQYAYNITLILTLSLEKENKWKWNIK